MTREIHEYLMQIRDRVMLMPEYEGDKMSSFYSLCADSIKDGDCTWKDVLKVWEEQDCGFQ